MPRTKKSETESEANDSSVDVKEERRGRVIKYMGSSDVRLLPQGETLLFSCEPSVREVRFDPSNGHMVNTADLPEIPEKFWDRLLSFDDFKEVTEEFFDKKKEVPKNLWEQIWSPSSRIWHPPIT